MVTKGKAMIELTGNELLFRFPEVHPQATCRISFQRTLRIPDDNRDYPLPPGLGCFPMRHVEDHASRLPEHWARRGGVLLPMYQAEALWINFSSEAGYPFAVKIAAGKINAITGEPWRDDLVEDPQDYAVVPDQPWIDGFCVSEGLVRQFVAMPLGDGYTAEEQLTGTAEHGGLQIIAYPMKRAHYEKIRRRAARGFSEEGAVYESITVQEMGLAPGGLMRQEIYEDDYGFDAWDRSSSSRCFVHILNSSQWSSATGSPMPTEPVSAASYALTGLPWFEHYNESKSALTGLGKLKKLISIAAHHVSNGKVMADNSIKDLDPSSIKKIGSEVRDKGW